MASSRRSAGDINILAMLDGLGSRPHAGRNMLWYGAGAVLVCGLIGTLVWLAHEPTTPLDAPTVSTPARASAASAPPIPIERVAEVPPAPADPQPPAAPVPAQATSAAPADTTPPTVPAPKPAPAAHAPAAKSPGLHGSSARAVASPHPGAAHARRNAPLVKPVPAPAAVDTDVALISAIIQHAANQRDATPETCTDKACGPRMPSKP